MKVSLKPGLALPIADLPRAAEVAPVTLMRRGLVIAGTANRLAQRQGRDGFQNIALPATIVADDERATCDDVQF